MSAALPELLRRSRQWADFADEDLRLARLALTLASTCPYRLVAFHAQQCAEKYLKAFLVVANVDFPYTHNIRRLRELCEGCDAAFGAVTEIDDLTTFAVTARYPGEGAEVSRDEAEQAIELAQAAREATREALGRRSTC